MPAGGQIARGVENVTSSDVPERHVIPQEQSRGGVLETMKVRDVDGEGGGRNARGCEGREGQLVHGQIPRAKESGAMIEINALTFWGLCAMAAVGVLQAAATLLQREEKTDWTRSKYAPPGEAPEGFRWVLVKDE